MDNALAELNRAHLTNPEDDSALRRLAAELRRTGWRPTRAFRPVLDAIESGEIAWASDGWFYPKCMWRFMEAEERALDTYNTRRRAALPDGVRAALAAMNERMYATEEEAAAVLGVPVCLLGHLKELKGRQSNEIAPEIEPCDACLIWLWRRPVKGDGQ